LDLLHFDANGSGFYIDLRYVVRVIPLTLLTPVPNTPNFFAGVLSLSNQSIPVIDLLLRLGLDSSPYLLTHEIIICEQADKQVGLIVSGVNQVDSITDSNLQNQQLFAQDALFIGYVNQKNQDALLINLPQILAFDMTQHILPNQFSESVLDQELDRCSDEVGT
jgi:purine-binding chemotaxis protein CheW